MVNYQNEYILDIPMVIQSYWTILLKYWKQETEKKIPLKYSTQSMGTTYGSNDVSTKKKKRFHIVWTTKRCKIISYNFCSFYLIYNLCSLFNNCSFDLYLMYNFLIIVRLIIVRDLNTYNFFLKSRVPLMFSEHCSK